MSSSLNGQLVAINIAFSIKNEPNKSCQNQEYAVDTEIYAYNIIGVWDLSVKNHIAIKHNLLSDTFFTNLMKILWNLKTKLTCNSIEALAHRTAILTDGNPLEKEREQNSLI